MQDNFAVNGSLFVPLSLRTGYEARRYANIENGRLDRFAALVP
jgi:hypothetical protein